MPSRAANWPGRVYSGAPSLCGSVMAFGRNGWAGRLAATTDAIDGQSRGIRRAGIEQLVKGAVGSVAGEVVVIARMMIAGAAAVVAQRADDGQMMRLPGQVRQMLAQARRRGRWSASVETARDTSATASGFMSQVSMCEAPPLSQIMIVDFAVRRRDGGASA